MRQVAHQNPPAGGQIYLRTSQSQRSITPHGGAALNSIRHCPSLSLLGLKGGEANAVRAAHGRRGLCAEDLAASIPPSLHLGAKSSFTRRARARRGRSASNQFLQLRILAQFPDQFLDLLRLAFVRQQHRVVGLHQNGIAQADHGNGRAIFRPRVVDDVPRGVHVDEIRHGAVAFRRRP